MNVYPLVTESIPEVMVSLYELEVPLFTNEFAASAAEVIAYTVADAATSKIELIPSIYVL